MVRIVKNYGGNKILRSRVPYYFKYGRVLWVGKILAFFGGSLRFLAKKARIGGSGKARAPHPACFQPPTAEPIPDFL